MDSVARIEAMRQAADVAYKDYSAGKITNRAFNDTMSRLERDLESLRVAVKNRVAAGKYAGCADSSPAYGSSLQADGKGVVAANLSPMDLTVDQLREMHQAARRKQPYRVEIRDKAMGGAGAPPAGSVGVKATGSAVAEGAQWPGGLLPPDLRPELSQEFRYEFDRMADHIPTIAIEAPSIEYLIHTGNTNPAAVVEELGVKADIGMQLDTATAVPIKLAALASVSMEALQDFSYFASWVPRELSRAVINVETQQIVLGTGASGEHPGMTGFVNTPNVLTRAYNPGTDISGLDTLIQACNDIRVGPAYGKADLIALHPTTWDFLKRTKTTTDAFALAIMDPTSIGRLDNLFGVPTITNTFIPEGTGIVLDSNLAARYFVRQSLVLDQNPWGDLQWTTNQISFRCEMRSVLAVLRPSACCVVSGLGPLGGS